MKQTIIALLLIPSTLCPLFPNISSKDINYLTNFILARTAVCATLDPTHIKEVKQATLKVLKLAKKMRIKVPGFNHYFNNDGYNIVLLKLDQAQSKAATHKECPPCKELMDHFQKVLFDEIKNNNK